MVCSSITFSRAVSFWVRSLVSPSRSQCMSLCPFDLSLGGGYSQKTSAFVLHLWNTCPNVLCLKCTKTVVTVHRLVEGRQNCHMLKQLFDPFIYKAWLGVLFTQMWGSRKVKSSPTLHSAAYKQFLPEPCFDTNHPGRKLWKCSKVRQRNWEWGALLPHPHAPFYVESRPT